MTHNLLVWFKRAKAKIWVYHNKSLWLISLSSDWVNWITIADKNLWASVVWNDGDEYTDNNCWKTFQWWNNYWFHYVGELDNTSFDRVDASLYWPWNYYSNQTFIKTPESQVQDRSSVSNTNLWWWDTWTSEHTKWPCDEWFHIPTHNEFKSFRTTCINIWINTPWMYSSYFMIPYSWHRQSIDSRNVYIGMWNFFWSSTARKDNENSYWFELYKNQGICQPVYIWRSYWCFIRPFKNEPVIPDSTRTVLYQPN